MPLQSSGAISLDDIHVEAGGSTGSQATINDADIRALISKSAGAQMAFNEWYGASASIQISSGNSFYQAASAYVGESRHHFRPDVVGITGYASFPTFTLNGRNTQYVGMIHNSSNGFGLQLMDLANPVAVGQQPTLGHPANSGWTSVVLAGNGGSRTLLRTNASYSTSSVLISSGGTLLAYASASWTGMGGTQLFPQSNNTHNFTVTLNP